MKFIILAASVSIAALSSTPSVARILPISVDDDYSAPGVEKDLTQMQDAKLVEASNHVSTSSERPERINVAFWVQNEPPREQDQVRKHPAIQVA